VSLPTQVLRAAREGFGLPRGSVRVLSTRFGKVCLAHRAGDGTLTQLRLVRAQADTLARLDAETRWLEHLAVRHALRVPTPRGWHDGALVSPLLVDRDETRWHAIACRWVEGVHLDRGLRRTHFSAAGSLLAQLHRATADAPANIAAARPT
jgi:Ser/Thr protein kinase RdoA (MazF antagonist)